MDEKKILIVFVVDLFHGKNERNDVEKDDVIFPLVLSDLDFVGSWKWRERLDECEQKK